MSEIPYGYCQCGCGRMAPIAKRNYHSEGYKKGHPKRYLKGHCGRGAANCNWNGGRTTGGGNNGDYLMVRTPDHPHADCRGYVMEHILICEKALGKVLPTGAEPHHVNGLKADNSNSNLVICQDRAYHMLLHQRQRALAACGHANWRKCWICKKYDHPSKLSDNKHGVYHKRCNAGMKKKGNRLSTSTIF